MRADLGHDLLEGRGGIGRGEHHVAQRAARLAQVGGAGRRHRVEHRLRVGGGMHGAHAGGDHVAREVALEERAHHVSQRGGRARRRRHQPVPGGVELIVVDAVDEDRRVVGQRDALELARERRAHHHGPRPGGQVAAQRPPGRVGLGVRVAEGARTLDHKGHAVVAPGDVFGAAGLAQDDDLLAVGADQAALLVDDAHVAHAGLAVQKAVQRAVGAVLGDVLDDRVERGAHRPPHVDHDAVEIVARQLVPEHQLADAPQSVDAQRSLPSHGLRSPLRVGGAPRPRLF